MHQFSPAERSALRLDGQLHHVFGAFLAADEPDVLETRVLIARGEAPPHFVLDRLSAAWVWDCAPTPPRRASYCVWMERRSSKVSTIEWDVRHTRLDSGSVLETKAGSVLRPWWTLLHLLRWPPSLSDDEFRLTLGALLERCQLSPEEAVDRFDREQPANIRLRYGHHLRALAIGDSIHVIDGINAPHSVQHSIEMRDVTHLKDKAADGQTVS